MTFGDDGDTTFVTAAPALRHLPCGEKTTSMSAGFATFPASRDRRWMSCQIFLCPNHFPLTTRCVQREVVGNTAVCVVGAPKTNGVHHRAHFNAMEVCAICDSLRTRMGALTPTLTHSRPHTRARVSHIIYLLSRINSFCLQTRRNELRLGYI